MTHESCTRIAASKHASIFHCREGVINPCRYDADVEAEKLLVTQNRQVPGYPKVAACLCRHVQFVLTALDICH